MSNAAQKIVQIAELMATSGVKFGTSGARGLATDMSDEVCYAYTKAFLQYLIDAGDIQVGTKVAIAGDYRPSSPRIMEAAALAIEDTGCGVINCGFIPTPAVTCFAMAQGYPSLMVTGSHIPDDRNGIKFNKPTGEILKHDEQGICAQSVAVVVDKFNAQGNAIKPFELGVADGTAYDGYIQRYLDFFPSNCLSARRVAVYEHSSVARDAMVDIMTGLGADVIRLGHSEKFIPVDTEAVRPEDIKLAAQWAKEHHFDCIVSADGDGDRPLVGDENGEWLRGDVAGVLCAHYLQAQSVATPVSSNSALEKCQWFGQVSRTRIGSPFVIAAMNDALESGFAPVVGYEANGGFLIASDITLNGAQLKALPTRDAVIVHLTILLSAIAASQPISQLLMQLPQRYTSSDRLKEFPT
ncbi:phosphomannomutase, partial [Pseudomonadota bacterium]